MINKRELQFSGYQSGQLDELREKTIYLESIVLPFYKKEATRKGEVKKILSICEEEGF